MLYEHIAEQMHFYDFVFYEVEGKTMYVFCPNCGQMHEIDLHQRKVKEVKEKVCPCACFEYRQTHQPHFYRSRDELNDKRHIREIGVFRNDNGDAVLDVYWHEASFGIDNYDCAGNDDFAYPLKRYPIFSEKHVTKIRFKADGTMAYETRLYVPMFAHYTALGDWREAKQWRSTFRFCLIEESIENLKGTALEQWAKYIPRMVEAIENRNNIEISQLYEDIAGFLMRLHTNQAFRNLFKAGFDRLCYEDVIDKITGKSFNARYYSSARCTSYHINWRARRLEKILKVQLSKIDKLYDRDTLSLGKLTHLQNFAKYEAQNVELTRENLEIANAYRFGSIADIFEQIKLPISKAFKYLRRRFKTTQNTTCVSDYCDYLSDLLHFKIQLTSDVLFPRNFNAAHVRYATIRREQQIAANKKDFFKAIEPYIAFDYRDDDYEIKVIRSQAALIREATKMHNCSAGYVDSIIRGISVLFTVKQVAHPRTPYCMLEYSPQKMQIVQNRDTENNTPKDEGEISFVQNWLKNLVLPQMLRQTNANAS